MAGRDINIPFGPDQTGGLDLPAIAPENAGEVVDPFAEPVAGAGQTSYTAAPADAGYVQAQATAEYEPRFRAASDDALVVSDGAAGEEAAAQGLDDMQRSIAALRDSIGQGRELRAREKERKELADALEADHEELSDRENILANYHAIVAEQDSIINSHAQQRDTRQQELSNITAQVNQTEQQLEMMRAQHAQQLQPIEGELGRIRAVADQAKNDERSRKSELSAAESELRRASEGEGSTMAAAQHQQVQAAYEEARKRSEQAKEQLAQVQRTYDETKAQADQAEAPLERSIADLNGRADDLKEQISQLDDAISAARQRRQYCDSVYEHPQETAQMRSEVEAAELTAQQMDAEADALRAQLAVSKREAKKAKLAIGVLIAIIVIVIIAFVVIQMR